MRSIYLFIICFSLLQTKINTSAAGSSEVEEIFKQPCDPLEIASCKPPYLTCEENVITNSETNMEEKKHICTRKGFLPMEGKKTIFIIFIFL